MLWETGFIRTARCTAAVEMSVSYAGGRGGRIGRRDGRVGEIRPDRRLAAEIRTQVAEKADAVAGLSVWALLVPQSLAYATLAGVPVQYGLYSAFAALIAYPIFGTSRHLAEGPSAAICAVSRRGDNTPGRRRGVRHGGAAVPYAAALALATGVVYVVLGLLRLGWVSTFLSRAVIGGFVLGSRSGSSSTSRTRSSARPRSAARTCSNSGARSRSCPTPTSLRWRWVRDRWGCCGCATGVPGGRGPCLSWPWRSSLSRAFDLADHGVAVTGEVPTGLFTIGLPAIEWERHRSPVAGALAVVFVGYSESLAAARSMARNIGYEIDPNQELIAERFANGAAGLVGGFPVDGSLSKTSVAESAGQKSQMASLINAVLILLTMLFLAGSSTTAVRHFRCGGHRRDGRPRDVLPLRRYYRVNRTDWVFFIGAMRDPGRRDHLGGPDRRRALPPAADRALLPHVGPTGIGTRPRGPTTASREKEGLEPLPGSLVVRVEGPLFFADADRFRSRVKLSRGGDGPLTGVVVDAEVVLITDTDGADILYPGCRRTAVRRAAALALARVHPPVLALWERAGVIDAIGARQRLRHGARRGSRALRRPSRTAAGACERSRDGDGRRRRSPPRSGHAVCRRLPSRARDACPPRARAEGRELVPAGGRCAHHTPAERVARGKDTAGSI